MTLTQNSSVRRPRQIGPLSTAARLIVGSGLLVLALADGIGALDVVLVLVAANGVVFAVLAGRGPEAPPVRILGPVGHLVNIVLILGFYALNPVAANLFYGSAMLVAGARGYGACEMFAVWNWVRGRDDRFDCPFFLPVDTLEQHLAGSLRAC